MQELETVRYRNDDGVAVITIHRPDAMNSFNTQLRLDLCKAFEAARDDATVRVVLLTGEGRSFSAGADLKSSMDSDKTVEQQLQTEYRPVFEIIHEMPKPVIAAVGGSAAGIGMSYVLACDLVIMADNAFLLAPFSTISLVPDGGLNWMLVRQLGYRHAYQVAVEAERLYAERCVELGLANRTAPPEKLMDEAMDWARSLAERAPLSLAATKKAMRHAISGSWASTFDVEAPLQLACRESDDCKEGVQAFFDKRKPKFTGK